MNDELAERLIKLIDKQQEEFDAFTERLGDEAAALHRETCPNPKGSPCEQGFMRIYLEAWQARTAEKQGKSQVSIVTVSKQDLINMGIIEEEEKEQKSNGRFPGFYM